MASGIELNLAVAFSAGFVSFASPCVLPLVPVYLGYMTGAALDKQSGRLLAPRAVVLLHALSFVLGFSLVFVLIFGAGATLLGSLMQENRGVLQGISGVLLIVFGLHTLGVFNIPFLNYEKRQGSHQVAQKLISTGWPRRADKVTALPSLSGRVKSGASALFQVGLLLER